MKKFKNWADSVIKQGCTHSKDYKKSTCNCLKEAQELDKSADKWQKEEDRKYRLFWGN
jgi:hypothetical protein